MTRGRRSKFKRRVEKNSSYSQAEFQMECIGTHCWRSVGRIVTLSFLGECTVCIVIV
jgi:hypothetical protein